MYIVADEVWKQSGLEGGAVAYASAAIGRRLKPAPGAPLQLDAGDEAPAKATGNKGMTLERLRTLKPGEMATYYRGDFADDIRRSPGSYARILTDVREGAVALEKAGRIILSKRPAYVEIGKGQETTRKVRINQYLAVGL